MHAAARGVNNNDTPFLSRFGQDLEPLGLWHRSQRESLVSGSLAPTKCRRTTKQQMPAILRGALLVSRGNELIQGMQGLLAPDTSKPGIKGSHVVEIQRDESAADVSGDERQAALWVDKPLFHEGLGRHFLLVSLPAG